LGEKLKNCHGDDWEPLVLEPIPENLLREPIEYIFADHYRLRQVIATMDRYLTAGIFAMPLADDTTADVRVIQAYLCDELGLHITDEDEGLFPALLQQCRGDRDTKNILTTLQQEHEEDFALLPIITNGFAALLADKVVSQRELFETSVARFVNTQRRHIIWENNIVLPLARRYLEAKDMESIGRGMAARRSIDYPG
jgi:hemerythrin-like domain-containing protein